MSNEVEWFFPELKDRNKIAKMNIKDLAEKLWLVSNHTLVALVAAAMCMLRSGNQERAEEILKEAFRIVPERDFSFEEVENFFGDLKHEQGWTDEELKPIIQLCADIGIILEVSSPSDTALSTVLLPPFYLS